MALPFAVSYYDLRLKADRLYITGNPGLEQVSLLMKGGETVALASPDSAADRLFLQVLGGQRRADAGSIWVAHRDSWLDLMELPERQRKTVYGQTVGYLGPGEALDASTPVDIVSSGLRLAGLAPPQVEQRGREVMDWVGIPRRLWQRPVAGLDRPVQEQMMLARTFAIDYRVIVVGLDLTTLADKNRTRLWQLMAHRRNQGTSFIGRFAGEKIACDRTVVLPTSPCEPLTDQELSSN